MDNNNNNEEEEYILGIDEAGRGPVLGPMVYGVCFCPKNMNDKLKSLGFADSKTLSAEKRDKLFEIIKKTDFIQWNVDIISPETMSAKMLQKTKYSLNSIAHDSTIQLIRQALATGIKLTEIYVDPVGPCESYQRYLTSIFPQIDFTVENKADSKFPVVSAASICAKVTRDIELEKWQFKEIGITPSRIMGSGYPGDAKTIAWLNDHFDPIFGFPSLVRFSWSTCRKIIKEKGVQCDWGDDDSDDDDNNNAPPGKKLKTTKLGSFFASDNSSKSNTSSIPIRKRSKYFQRRKMNVLTSFNT